MPYPLGYRRPRYILPSPRYSKDSDDSVDRSLSDTANAVWNNTSLEMLDTQGIPEELSFNRIMSDSTRPPCTSRDFMDFLLYIEHSAENLQFYLWFQNYEWRFQEASETDTILSLPWTKQQEDDATVLVNQMAAMSKQAREALRRSDPHGTRQVFSALELTHSPQATMTDLEDSLSEVSAYRDSSPVSPTETQVGRPSTAERNNSYEIVANKSFKSIGLSPPFSIQPFRQEINLIIATYIAEDAPRQLNLSWKQRALILHALNQTTHPTAFRSIYKTVDAILRRQSHPNFIRWAICNGNPPRVIFGRALGVFLVMTSLAAEIILALSDAHRGWRALPVVTLVLGWSTIICAWKGICVVLLGMHARHVRPWELYEGASDEDEFKISFESMSEKKSYEAAPWRSKYDRRSLIRRTLERQVWIQEPAMRTIQNIIFWQSMAYSVVISGLLVCVFLLVPAGNFF